MKEVKGRKKFILLILLALIVMWMLYPLCAMPLITSAYEEKSINVVNHLFHGRDIHDLNYYFTRSIVMLEKVSVYAGVVCIFLLLPTGFILSVLSLLMTLGLINLFLFSYNAHLDRRFPDVSLDILWRYDQLLGWRHQEGASDEYIQKENRLKNLCVINSKGLRDQEYSYEKPDGVKRIWLAGDSGVAGFEVAQDDKIDVHLETLLNAYGKFEVLNGGNRGYGTDQSYLFLKEEGLKYHPDYVIYVWFRNDPENNITIHRPNRKYGKSYFVLDGNKKLQLRGVPVPEKFTPPDRWILSNASMEEFYNHGLNDQLLIQRQQRDQYIYLETHKNFVNDLKIDLKRLGKFILNTQLGQFVEKHVRLNKNLNEFFLARKWISPESHYVPDNKPKKIINQQWEITEALIKEMSTVVRSSGAQFLVYEYYYDVNAQEPTRLKQVCDRLNIAYLNSFTEYQEASKGRRFFHLPHDEHWNGRGHQLAAQGLFDYLKQTGFVQ